VARRNDEAVLVVGDRHQLIHVLDLLIAQADALWRSLVDHAIDVLARM
jgi:hypothetical protein